MSWKSLVTAGLLCVLASPAFAAPALTVTGSINNKAGSPVRVWNVAATPDLALDSPTALALELGFQATGGNILSISATPNMAAAAAPAPARVDFDTNPGNVIFGWETLTDLGGGNMKPVGVQIGSAANANKAVAFLGSNLFSDAGSRDLLTITTDSSVTSLAWGGRYNADGSMAALTGSLPALARIAQGNGASSANFQEASFAGSLGAVGATNLRFLGDMNGNNSVNNLDVVPFSNALAGQAAFKTANPRLNILRGDINGSGTFNNLDVVPFSQILAGSVSGSGSVAAVPEPASLVLLGCVVAFASSVRRRGSL